MSDTTIPIGGTAKTLRGFDTGAGIDEYVRDALSPYRGTSTPQAGESGTVSVASGHRIVSITCYSALGGSVAIGSVTVPLPPGGSFSDGYSGLVGPLDVVFTGTDLFYVVTNG